MSLQLLTPYPSNALNHPSGDVLYDFTRDGFTDLILFPTQFNQGSDLPGMAYTVQNGVVTDLTSSTLPAMTTGFVKDWFVGQLGGDTKADLLLIDHGLELPASQGGFENGSNRLLIAGSSGLSLDSAIAALPKSFYHSGAIGHYLGAGANQIVFQQFAAPAPAILLLQQDASGSYQSVSLGSTFSNYAYMPGAVATVHVAALGHDLLALGSYVTADFATGQKSISLWDLTGSTPTKVANWDLPAQFNNPSQGAFKIIAGDFRGTGHDDLVVLLESVDLTKNYQRSWVYLAYDGAHGLTDMTAGMLGSYQAPQNVDEIKVADVNNDGHPDLVGFTGDATAFSGNKQILLNDGTGRFSWMDTKSISTDQTSFIPRFKVDDKGNLSDLQGFFKLSLTGANSATLDYQALSASISTGPGFSNPAAQGVAGFNETYYLNNHPDAAQAVAAGQYANGLDHYLKVGRALNYQAFAAGTNVVGTSGVDTVVYSGARADYKIEKSMSGYAVSLATGASAADSLSGIERLKFTDSAVAFDVAGTAGQAYRLYQAAFNRQPDLAGLGWQIKAMDAGTTLTQLSQNFMNSAEFKSLYGSSPSYNTLVNLLYQNVLHRTPQQFETDFWVGILSGTNPASHQTPAEVLTNFSESAENQAQVLGVIQNGIEYHFYA
jgi:hypothetical protein